MSSEQTGQSPLPDLDSPSPDALHANRQELLESSHGFPLDLLSIGDQLIIVTDPPEGSDKEGQISLEFLPRAKQEIIRPNESVRVLVNGSNIPSVAQREMFELEGASIDGFMHEKGIIRRGCNATLTPLKMVDIRKTPIIDETNEVIRQYAERGIIEYIGGFFHVPNLLTSKPVEIPAVQSLARVNSDTHQVRQLPWMPPSSLDSSK